MLLKFNIILLFVTIDRFVYTESKKLTSGAMLYSIAKGGGLSASEGQILLSGAVKVVLLLTVYYESNCPDSKAFILEQLQPAFHVLHHHVTIKFVPFGKARSINYGDGGFKCQHGSAECLGNIVQDCSLHLMKGQSDKNKLSYVACEMKSLAASQGRFDCVQRANLQTNLVEECVLFGKGTNLQLESEYYTNLVDHKFIPTITINGVYNQEIQDYAQVDLLGALCSQIIEAPPCSRYYNLMALHNLMGTNLRLHGK